MPRTLLTGIATLTLAMTHFFNRLCEQSEAISREGVGLRKHIFLTLVVGYFADAQYDVLLLPPSGEVSATPTIGDKSAR